MSAHDPAGQAPPGARAVLLVRSRPGLAEQAIRTVHLAPVPATTPATATTATAELGTLCGARFGAGQIETVTPGHGVPCTLCLIVHLCGPTLPSTPDRATTIGGPGRLKAAADYHAWGWPVTLRRDQIWLRLGTGAVALIIPTGLATDVTRLLTTRRCPPPVLAHPHAPGHRIVLGSEPYGVPLPWPPGVHPATGIVPLPPTRTPRGAVTWVQFPHPTAFQLCREIDIFGALHTLGKIAGGS